MFAQGWFMVDLNSVECWAKVHVGIQGVYTKIDRQTGRQTDRDRQTD